MHLYDVTRLEDRVVGKILATQADAVGDDIWLMSDDRKVTFGEAHEQVNRIAHGLSRLGVGRGDLVSMLMEPSIELILTGIAASRLGAIFTPLSTDYKGEFLRNSIEDTTAHVLVADAALAPRLADIERPPALRQLVTNGERIEVPGLESTTLEDFAAESTASPDVEARFDDPLMVWWSSGTTGKPKGIIHWHSSLLRAASVWNSDRSVREDDRYYTCFPMYLGGAWTGAVWPSLLAGIPAGIDPRFSVNRFWDRTRHYGATITSTLGSMHIFLMEAPERPDDADNPVRFFAPVPMPWDMVPRFKERFGIEHVIQIYGQSETCIDVFLAPDDGTVWKPNTMGRTTFLWDVRLVDDNDCEVAVGEVGEITMRPTEPYLLFAGYFNQPELTAACWRNLWHHTGDLARRDEDGQYFFADRKKDYIRHKGRNISMVEVETVVQKHPSVAEVAAYGVGTAELESESELMLAIVLRPGRATTADEMATFVNENAPYYFVPRFIRFMDELPHNGQYKIEKLKLRAEGPTPDAWDRDASGFVVTR